MRYYVAAAKNMMDLIAQVQEYLDDGWELQGGISISDKVCCQAVIKRGKS